MSIGTQSGPRIGVKKGPRWGRIKLPAIGSGSVVRGPAGGSSPESAGGDPRIAERPPRVRRCDAQGSCGPPRTSCGGGGPGRGFCQLIATEAAGRLDGADLVHVEIDDCLQGLAGGGVVQRSRQGVEPDGVFCL